MKTKILIALLATASLSCRSMPGHRSTSLFNGQDITGWHVDVPKMDNDANARNPFIVRNGMLVSLGTPGGHLISDAV